MQSPWSMSNLGMAVPVGGDQEWKQDSKKPLLDKCLRAMDKKYKRSLLYALYWLYLGMDIVNCER